VATALLFLFAAMWVVKRFTGNFSRVIFLLLVLAAGYSVYSALGRQPAAAALASGWQEYSAEKVAAARAENKPVFIDFTAAWCLTCQVNKATVLDRAGMKEFFRERGVELFRADWTNSDPLITKALETYGRIGVPVYVAYAAGAGEPLILPQILTEDIVRRAYP
jgi:thiol:disulfide interchange protein DsbD